MLKRILFAAVAPMLLVAGNAFADDDLLGAFAKLDGDKSAAAQLDADKLGKADVDALMSDENESNDEAIAACFRRFGYGWGHRHYYRSYSHCYPRYRSYSYGYNYGYPSYSQCYTPVTYSYYTPRYTSYWGCW